MRPGRIFMAALFVAVVFEAIRLEQTTAALRALERRIAALDARPMEPASLAGSAGDDRTPAAGVRPGGESLRTLLSGLNEAAGREQLRQIMAEQARMLQQEQRDAQTMREQLAIERGRIAAAHELGLSDSELRQFEDLGQSFRDVQDKEARGELTPVQVNEEYQRLSGTTEDELHRLLGDERYQRLSAARRDHPEYGRYLLALRPSSVPPAPSTEPTPPRTR